MLSSKIQNHHKLSRLYYPLSIEQKFLTLQEAKVVNYLKNVLRLKEGDHFRLFNEMGEYLVNITQLSKKYIQIEVLQQLRCPYTPAHNIIVGMSIIKNDQMLEAINGITQLGVSIIVPVLAARSQVSKINSERLNRCLIEFTEQSERLNVPILSEVTSLSIFCQLYPKSIIYASEREVTQNLNNFSDFSESIILLIGPEGGFNEAEFDLLKSHRSVSLGKNILRAEVAAISLMAQLQLKLQ